MIVMKQGIHGERPWEDASVFELTLADYEVGDGYCQLQCESRRRAGFDAVRVDWGDGTVKSYTGSTVWHNYRAPGKYRVSFGREFAWWRLWEAYTVTAAGRMLISRPRIRPVCWSDFLESCEGTYCGWSNSDHGGVVGPVIPWGRSIRSTFCCYQCCVDLTGRVPEWTDATEDATGTFDRCRGLSGCVPRWGKNIREVNQCYAFCAGLSGAIPKWPKNCRTFNSCYEGATGLSGSVPEWPVSAEELNAVFSGCTGISGTIPPWPSNIRDVSACYKNCTNLTGAWTDDPDELMPEEKLRASPNSDWYRCEDVVTGCADSLRALFREKYWGGLIPSEEEV